MGWGGTGGVERGGVAWRGVGSGRVGLGRLAAQPAYSELPTLKMMVLRVCGELPMLERYGVKGVW